MNEGMPSRLALANASLSQELKPFPTKLEPVSCYTCHALLKQSVLLEPSVLTT